MATPKYAGLQHARYDTSEIVVLNGLDAVRKRPTMYVGPLDNPLVPNTLLQEALCCARDEAFAGRCDLATITLHAGIAATVRDHGPGLPLDLTATGSRVAEDYLTQLHACASAKSHADAKTTCTLGLAVLNALSSNLRLRVFQAGAEWRQTYVNGKPTCELAPFGPTSEHGTEFSFTLDTGILPHESFVFDELRCWAERAIVKMALQIRDETTGIEIRIPRRAV
jgi:DNA gyrase subunit B